jgi:hypothetical protein
MIHSLACLQVLAEAFAMAYALNRTLVPPSFVCYCDQDWAADVLDTCTIIGKRGPGHFLSVSLAII